MEVCRLSQALVARQQEVQESEAGRQETQEELKQLQERTQELEGLLAELRQEAQCQQEQAEQGDRSHYII